MNEILRMIGQLAANYFATSTPEERARFAEHLLVMIGLMDAPTPDEEEVRVAPEFAPRLAAFRTQIRAELGPPSPGAYAFGPERETMPDTERAPHEAMHGYFRTDDEPTLVTGEMPELRPYPPRRS